MIDETKLLNLLDRVLGSRHKKHKKQGQYAWFCPFCNHHKPKLEINIIKSMWHCWVCDKKGRSLFPLFKSLKASKENFNTLSELVDDRPLKKQTDDVKQSCSLPHEFKPMWEKSNMPVYKHALMYLKKRGVTKEDMIKYNIGYCDSGLYSNRIIIPSYDEFGQLNFFVGRDIYDSPMKYRNTPTTKDVVGFELFINWDEPIVLCEGPFDAMAIKRNSIPLFGKQILNSLKRKIIEKKVRKIYISLDRDAMSDSLKMIEEFMRNGIDVYFVNLTEKDPSDLGFEKMIDILYQTVKMKFSDLMRYKLNGKKRSIISLEI